MHPSLLSSSLNNRRPGRTGDTSIQGRRRGAGDGPEAAAKPGGDRGGGEGDGAGPPVHGAVQEISTGHEEVRGGAVDDPEGIPGDAAVARRP